MDIFNKGLSPRTRGAGLTTPLDQHDRASNEPHARRASSRFLTRRKRAPSDDVALCCPALCKLRAALIHGKARALRLVLAARFARISRQTLPLFPSFPNPLSSIRATSYVSLLPASGEHCKFQAAPSLVAAVRRESGERETSAAGCARRARASCRRLYAASASPRHLPRMPKLVRHQPRQTQARDAALGA